MELSDIIKIQEVITQGFTTSSSNKASENVNKLLNEGWILLKIYTTCYDDEVFPNQQTLHYVLGLPKSLSDLCDK
ncbi:hypothetical protein EXQ37_11115 [Clostridium botulinum]|nr:hypothetical protein [Clostridium botulinum]MBO0555729.1 hypothetical protein [Clostridium botulinum]MBO0560275.1 hypothetical protein [Clostridium botulinum]NFS21374.1 hypothetical protein [Clostridium botulinum]